MTKKVVPLKSKKKNDDALTHEDMQVAQQILDSMPPEVLAEFRRLAENCENEDEFTKEIFIGDCPKCGSSNVHDCDDTPFGDITIGQCTDCGTLWCIECDTIFAKKQTVCGHWDICDACELCDDDGWCGTPFAECNKIKKWQKNGDKAGPAKMKKEKNKQETSSLYQLRVSLCDSEPEIWRRIIVSGDTNLGFLHAVLQVAFGWTNSHLHQFDDGENRYADPQNGEDNFFDDDDEESLDEFLVPISDVLHSAGDELGYLYDFGDSWEHVIVLEEIMKEHPQYLGLPLCIDGARACPPDDCGGMGGYVDLCQIIKSPKNDGYDEMMDWLGGKFNPEEFDVKKTNIFLQKIKWKKPSMIQLAGILELRDGN